MERATGTEVYGCGSPQSTDITLNIQTTTGGNFSISVNGKNTVESLKKAVSKKLKVAKDRICLLHRERQLRDGTLEENGLLDGSRVILLPSVETGLLSQRPENSVMQALESLNETQVNDFLSGKSPLNLTMRLGDHMMLIQLQLSTLNSGGSSGTKSLRTSIPTNLSSSRLSKKYISDSTCPRNAPGKTTLNDSKNCNENNEEIENQSSFLQNEDLEILKNALNLYPTMPEETDTEKVDSNDEDEDILNTAMCEVSDLSGSSINNEQSPIKSLSNLVSSPLDTTAECDKESIANSVRTSLIDLLSKNKVINEALTPTKSCSINPISPIASITPDSSLSEDSDNFTDQSSFLSESTIDEYPMENLFNSAVDKGLFEEQDESMMDQEISNLATMSHGTQESTTAGALPSFQSINEPLKTKRFQYLLHKTSKFKHPISQSKQKVFMQSVVNKHKKRMQIRQDNHLAQPSTSRTEPYITNSRKLILQPSNAHTDDLAIPSTSKQTFRTPETPKKTQSASPTPQVDTKDLIEASKNLTQKLKKLSKEVLTNKIDLRAVQESVRSKIGPGAVIESMKHHGKGIYSGTFSGTLNPALQDRYGRPKRDISTIIHILNDLLCASPPIAMAQKEAKHACTTTVEEASQAPVRCGACAARPAGEACRKCDAAKALAVENSKTKCKLEQLRLVMQQKKQRREARKLKTLPYATPPKTLGSPEPPPARPEEVETLA